MPARLRVVHVFQITHRGRVVAGDILDGVVRRGMLAGPEADPSAGSWLVTSVSFVERLSTHESHVALVLADAPPLDELRLLLPQGAVVAIHEPRGDVAA